MAGIRKARPTLAGDFFNNSLADEDKQYITSLLKIPNISVPDIHRYLISRGFTGSLSSTYNWYNQVKVIGEKAQTINTLLENYQGIDSNGILYKIIGILSNKVDEILLKIENPEVDADIETYIKILPQLLKELRTTAETVNNNKYIADRKALEMAGAASLAIELERAFKHEPFFPALKEGIIACVMQLEDRILS